MELRQLSYFVAVAEEGSFTRASERLYIAQPAVSRQVGHLERELGARLFARRPDGVRLTAAPHDVARSIREHAAIIDALAAGDPDRAADRLRVHLARRRPAVRAR